jgi:DNA-binding CsgD family transcriptional regulator
VPQVDTADLAGHRLGQLEELQPPDPLERDEVLAGVLQDRQRGRVHQDLGGEAPVTVPSGLTPRELDTLRPAAVGASNREIAAGLGSSTETVKAYLRGAVRKLEVHNRTAAVHAARSTGAL